MSWLPMLVGRKYVPVANSCGLFRSMMNGPLAPAAAKAAPVCTPVDWSMRGGLVR